MRLCKGVSHLFEAEPRCVFLQSPIYVFGDIHGNLEVLFACTDVPKDYEKFNCKHCSYVRAVGPIIFFSLNVSNLLNFGVI